MESKETTRIVKAHAARHLGASVAFNFEDLRRRCDEYIEKVRQQTQQMIQDAHNEAEKIRKEAFEKARAEGRQEGLQQAAQQIEKQSIELAEKKSSEKLKTTLPALQAVIDEMVKERQRWQQSWEASGVRLSVAIAEKLLRRQIEVHPDAAGEMIKETLQLAAGTPQLRIRMNPRDVESLGPQAEEIVSQLASCGEASISADENIECGGALIETQHGTIDARLETQLERITSELLE